MVDMETCLALFETLRPYVTRKIKEKGYTVKMAAWPAQDHLLLAWMQVLASTQRSQFLFFSIGHLKEGKKKTGGVLFVELINVQLYFIMLKWCQLTKMMINEIETYARCDPTNKSEIGLTLSITHQETFALHIDADPYSVYIISSHILYFIHECCSLCLLLLLN